MITSIAMRLFLALSATLLQGCVFVPRTTTAHDEQCNVQRRYMKLETAQAGTLGSCSQKECVYILAALGAVAAASLVVSGSIAVVGNGVYWLEKQGQCRRNDNLSVLPAVDKWV